jgi:hypothetical protein
MGRPALHVTHLNHLNSSNQDISQLLCNMPISSPIDSYSIWLLQAKLGYAKN